MTPPGDSSDDGHDRPADEVAARLRWHWNVISGWLPLDCGSLLPLSLFTACCEDHRQYFPLSTR